MRALMTAFLKILFLCLLLPTLTSCHYVSRLRGLQSE